jgi:Pyruvate/2-oxoacid:ferredoxin oxidoreductase gamma subunit
LNLKLVIAGIGGQGVVYATKILSQAGLLRGEKVMASENHGMSQRGGSVMSHLKIGGSEAFRASTSAPPSAGHHERTMKSVSSRRSGAIR